MTFQQRKICKWALISIFIFSFDNAFADKAVINENACRRQEIGSASFHAQFPNAGIMENEECCQLFGARKNWKSRMQMRCWHPTLNPLRAERADPIQPDVCLKRAGDGLLGMSSCIWESADAPVRPSAEPRRCCAPLRCMLCVCVAGVFDGCWRHATMSCSCVSLS